MKRDLFQHEHIQLCYVHLRQLKPEVVSNKLTRVVSLCPYVLHTIQETIAGLSL